MLLFPGGELQAQLSPRIESFGSRDYDAHTQIFSTLYDTAKGRWYLGTQQEVLSFDGKRFRHIEVGDSKARSVYSMALTKDTLWVGAQGDFGYVTGSERGEAQYRSLLDRLPDSLHSFQTIWDTYAHERFTIFNGLEALFIHDRTRDSLAVVELQGPYYLSHLVGDSLILQKRGLGLKILDLGDRTDPSASPERMPFGLKGMENMEGSDLFALNAAQGIFQHPPTGTPIVFTRRDGAFLYREATSGPSSAEGKKAWKTWSEELARYSVYDVMRLEDAYAVGTKFNGLLIVNDSASITHHFTPDQGLADRYVWSMEEGAGAIGAGTDNGFSLIRFSESIRTMVPEEDQESGYKGTLRDVHFYKDRIYLAATQGVYRSKALSELGPKGDPEIRPIDGTQEQISGFEELYDGSLAIIAGNGGIVHLTSSEVRKEAEKAKAEQKVKLHAKCMDVIHRKDHDLVAVGGRTGVHLFRYRDGQWKELYNEEEIPQDILSIAFYPTEASKEGKRDEGKGLRLVMGLTDNGILHGRTKGDSSIELQHVDSTQGLPPGNVFVRSFQRDSKEGNGEVLVANTSERVYRISIETSPDASDPDSCTLSSYCGPGDIFCKVPGEAIHLSRSGPGKIWLSGEKTLQEHTRSSKGEWELDTVPYRSLDIGDIRGLATDEEGGLWIAGDQGLGYRDPELDKAFERPFSSRFQKIALPISDTNGGRSDSVIYGGWGMMPKNTRLSYSRNDLKFEWTSTHFYQRERTRYRHKLEGYDPNWSSWTSKPEKAYTNLPEGDYVFKVKARNLYGRESTVERYNFTILPPWYRTYWAYGGYSLAGLGLVWLIVWLNGRRLLAQKQRLERTVEERTKEIREQKEKVEEAHKEITQSIDYAQKIQQALLQSEEHVADHLPEHFILFKPQSQVSGDFYWAQEHKGHFYIAAVDCTGHGVPGAFMSMLGISQLNEIMKTDEELTPGFILTELRKRVIRELSSSDPESAAKDGMDAAIVKIANANPNSNSRGQGVGRYSDTEGFNSRREVEFAGAQNPLYVIRKGIAEGEPERSRNLSGQYDDPETGNTGDDVIGPIDLTDPKGHDDRIRPFKRSPDGIEIKGDGQPVGYDEYAKETFTTVKLKLKKDDVLYFFSDGYADQFGGPKGKKFRYGPFKQLLASIHEKPLEEQKEELDRTFEEWKEESDQEQVDDVVVIGVRL